MKIYAAVTALLSILCSAVWANPVPLADPFILLHEETYYAYGTLASDGIVVFSSRDLETWKYEGYALRKGNVWGEKWFWAPEVYRTKDGFLMYYSADTFLCAAKSDSPLGPFSQAEKTQMLPENKAIDHTLFIDTDGRPYIYFSRLLKGNVIWSAELENDLVTIRRKTMKYAIAAQQDWEKRKGLINEGSAVLKHDGKYYLTYSGNDYQSPFYGIGYAVSDSPQGPWKKYENNPVFQLPGNLVGVGHHSFFKDKAGKLRVVFHAHNSKEKIHPRLMYITTAEFRDGKLYISPDYITPRFTNPEDLSRDVK